ncbi:hypothetical protein B0H13DRAFT_2343964 [Mycena leptocephala]|nr:hypothetical protein B0H13DRAFT_2343964 [Mycena leptocephala]
MSDTSSTNYLENKLTKAEITKRRRKASQEKYRTTHSERLRATARLRMQRLCAEMENNEHKKKLAWERRREIDAEYREVLRRQKFVKNHGITADMDDYVPLLNEFNSYQLVGVEVKLSKDEKEVENGSGEDEGEE